MDKIKSVYILVETTIIKEDMPSLMVVFEHFLEHFYGLGRNPRPTSRSRKARRRRRGREQSVKGRLAQCHVGNWVSSIDLYSYHYIRAPENLLVTLPFLPERWLIISRVI